MTEVVSQSCRTVYVTTIMIINSANLKRASTSYSPVVDQHYMYILAAILKNDYHWDKNIKSAYF